MRKIFARFLNMSRNNVIYNSLACINSLHLFMESTSSRVKWGTCNFDRFFLPSLFSRGGSPCYRIRQKPAWPLAGGGYCLTLCTLAPYYHWPEGSVHSFFLLSFWICYFGFCVFGRVFLLLSWFCFIYLPLAGQRSWSVWEVSPIFTQERLH